MLYSRMTTCADARGSTLQVLRLELPRPSLSRSCSRVWNGGRTGSPS